MYKYLKFDYDYVNYSNKKKKKNTPIRKMKKGKRW